MRSFLLLLLSLIKGCEASSEESVVKGCPTGWVEFTCKYTGSNRKFENIVVFTPQENITIKSTENDAWENKGRVSLYHDKIKKNLIVAIKQLEHEDFGEYKCQFQSNETKTLIHDKNGCQRQFNQTTYRTAKTTITCDYTGNEYKFFCKENGFICEDILSTKPSVKSNGKFTLTETNSSFSMSISKVSSLDAGVYWCGVETHEGSYRAALRKIQLEVEKITSFTRSPTIGQNLTYWCKYSDGPYINMFICKGEDPSVCQPLVSTQGNNNTGKFSMVEDDKRNVTITVREVTTNDTGTYWCGAKSTNETLNNKFFHKMVMTVVLSTVSPTSSTTLVSSTQSTTVSAESHGGSLVIITVIVSVAVLLLFLLIFILIYKRFSHSKNKRKGAAAQNIREDYVYEEIQPPVQTPDSGTEMNTINASASLHYSTINFQSSSDRAASSVRDQPSSAACEYSSVKQSATYSTVNQPSSSSEDPLYATVNKP